MAAMLPDFEISKEAMDIPDKPSDYDYWMHHFQTMSTARQVSMSVYSIPWDNIWKYINIFFGEYREEIRKKYLAIFLDLDLNYVIYANKSHKKND